jgi:hypothetical protein
VHFWGSGVTLSLANNWNLVGLGSSTGSASGARITEPGLRNVWQIRYKLL